MHSAALRTRGAPERRRSGFNLGRDDPPPVAVSTWDGMTQDDPPDDRDGMTGTGFNLGRDDRGWDGMTRGDGMTDGATWDGMTARDDRTAQPGTG
jgi:hypothetical protein